MKIGIVTGSRSEWGLLLPLARKIDNHPDCSLEIFITGSHFRPQNGDSWRDVVDDFSWRGVHLIDTQMASDSNVSVCRTVGLTLSSIAESFAGFMSKKLDCIIILGDRYESFAAAVAAHIMQIPIVHIHGGEITSDGYDDSFRHSITKMASLHLVATELYGKRVVQLGEEPDRVFVCGALGVEALDLFRSNAIKNEKSVVVCYNPVTFAEDGGLGLLKSMCKVLVERRNDFIYEIIGPNADSGNDEIRNELLNLYRSCQPNAFYYNNLPRISFLQIIASSKFIIGNSSAGIIEAPALGTPTINLGSRQRGRMMAGSIMQADTEQAISSCIDLVSNPTFMQNASAEYCPYGTGGPVAQKMLDTILANQDKLKRRKVFHDII